MTSILPQLVIFDLDFTLWILLLKVNKNSIGKTNKPRKIWEFGEKPPLICKHYPEVPAVLEKLKNSNIKIAIASLSIVKNVHQMIKSLDWDKYISFVEIYPDPRNKKTVHFKNIQKKSKIPFSEMILFDDELESVNEAQKLGIFSVHVNSTDKVHGGMKMETLNNALKDYELLKQQRKYLE